MSDQCNEDVFKYGESVGIFDMDKEEANAKCAEMTDITDFIYDWHYAMGRVHVKRLRKGFVREQRYILIKQKDMDAAELTNEERQVLDAILAKIAKKRHDLGKEPLEAVVIEKDWACYDDAWKLVIREWGSKP